MHQHAAFVGVGRDGDETSGQSAATRRCCQILHSITDLTHDWSPRGKARRYRRSQKPRHGGLSACTIRPPLPDGLAMDGRWTDRTRTTPWVQPVRGGSLRGVLHRHRREAHGLARELETLMTGGSALEWHIADLRTGSAHLAMRPHTDPRSAERVSAWLTLRHLIRVQVARLARGERSEQEELLAPSDTT